MGVINEPSILIIKHILNQIVKPHHIERVYLFDTVACRQGSLRLLVMTLIRAPVTRRRRADVNLVDLRLQGGWLPPPLFFLSISSLIRILLKCDPLFATDVGLLDLNTSKATALE